MAVGVGTVCHTFFGDLLVEDAPAKVHPPGIGVAFPGDQRGSDAVDPADNGDAPLSADRIGAEGHPGHVGGYHTLHQHRG